MLGAVWIAGVPFAGAGPANDNFGAARDLGSAEQVEVVVDSNDATRQVGEPAHGGDSWSETVWWRWSAPGDGCALISLDTGNHGKVAVYSGDALDALAEVASGAIGSTLRVPVEDGVSYAVVVAGCVRGRMDLRFFPRPANDDFAERTDMGAAAEWSAEARTAAASREEGEPMPGGETSLQGSVWWKWTAPEDGLVRYDLAGSSGHHWAVGVYTGEDFSTLQLRSPRVRWDEFLGVFGGVEAIRVRAGEVFSISASCFSSTDPFQVRVHWSFEPTPWQAAPEQAADLGTADEASGTADLTEAEKLWWRWTAPADGEVSWSVNRTGGTASTLTSKFYDAGLDEITGPPWFCRAGETYYLSVEERIAEENKSLEYSLTLAEAPPNDRIANASALSAGGEEIAYDLAASRTEDGEPSWSGQEWERSVWWNWTAPGDGLLWIENTSEPAYKTCLAAWEIGGAAEPLAGDPSGAAIVLRVRPGMELRVGVMKKTRYFGEPVPSGVLRARFIPSVPDNDAFADAVDLGSAPQAFGFGSPKDASIEEGEPDVFSNEGSLWWKWTAPFDCAVDFQVARFDDGKILANGNLDAYTGSSLDALSRYNNREILAGETLWISLRAVSTSSEDGRFFELSAKPIRPAGNDAFADALDLGSAEEWSDEFLFGHATYEDGEPDQTFNSFPDAGSLWWKWTAPRDGNLVLESGMPGTSMQLNVYRGDSLDSLHKVFSARNGSPSRGAIAVEQGEELRVSIEAMLSAGISLHWSLVDIPPGDRYAAPVDLGAEVQFTTTVPEEGGVAEEADKVLFPNARRTFWWVWTAPGDGILIGEDSAWRLFEDAPQGQALVGVEGGRVVAGRRYRIAYSQDLGAAEKFWEFHAVPQNDVLAGAVDLGSVESYAGDLDALAAAADAGEIAWLSAAENPPAAAVWWKWTSPFDGVLDVEAGGRYDRWRVAILSGADPQSLRVLASEDSGLYNEYQVAAGIDVRAGETYWILAGMNGAGPVSLEIDAHSAPPPPANDDWSAAIDLGSASPATGRTDNTGAHREEIEPEDRNGSVWWRWTAPGDGNAFFAAGMAGQGLHLDIYRLSGGGTPELLDPWEAVSETGYAEVRLRAQAGQTYLIAASGKPGNWGGKPKEGVIALRVVWQEMPANDDFAAAAVLPSGLPLEISGSSDAATSEPGEPAGIPAASRWWAWTPEADETVRADLSGGQAAVYQGDSFDSLVLVKNIRSSPDFLSVNAGRTYWIAMGGAQTWFRLSLNHAATPPNDDFANRRDLGSAVDLEWQADNLQAGAEPGEPDHAGSAASRSLWYSWQAPAGGYYAVDARSNYGVYRIGVYAGESLQDLSAVAGGAGRAIFEATAGQRVVFAVDGPPGWMKLGLHAVAGAPNDNFSDRVVLAGLSAVLEGDTGLAGVEEHEPGIDAGSDRDKARSLWWEWVAPVSGKLGISPEISTRAEINLYTSYRNPPEIGRLRRVYSTYSSSISVSEGKRYFIQVITDSHAPAGARFGYAMTLKDRYGRVIPPPPENDEFDERIDLGSALGVIVVGTMRGSTPDAGQTGSSDSSIWWSWTAPRSGVFGVGGRAGAGVVCSVMRGENLGDLSTIASGRENVWFEAQAGETYAIRFSGRDSSFRRDSGMVQFEMVVPEPPANDAFADAEELPDELGLASHGTLAAASTEPGEPQHGGQPASRSVWFRWSARESGPVELVLSGGSPTGAVYAGESLASIVEIASGRGAVAFDAQAGMVYRIAVASDRMQDFHIRLQSSRRPANDDFSDARVLAGSPVSVQASVSASSLETGEPYDERYGSLGEGGSVWWRWTAPAAGPVEVSLDQSAPDMWVSVYSGDALDALIPIGSSEEGVVFHAEAGREYRISVSIRFLRSDADFTMRLEQRAAAPPNDLFAGAQVLEGAVDRASGGTAGASREAGEPSFGAQLAGPTVWYRWTVPGAGPARVSLSGWDGGRVVVCRGSSFGDLEEIASGDTAAEFIAIPGETVFLAVGAGWGTEPGPFEIGVEWIGYQAEGGFDGARDLGSARDVSVVSSLASPPGTTDSLALWWKWTAPQDGNAVVTTDGGLLDSIHVYRGESAGVMEYVASGSAVDSWCRVVFRAKAGEEYRIVAGGSAKEGDPAIFRLGVRWFPAGNDDFADRIELPAGLPASGEAEVGGATCELGEKADNDETVWWSWTARMDGWVDLDLSGSDFLVQADVSTGRDPMLLDSVHAFEVADGVWRFEAVAGTVYRIRVRRSSSQAAFDGVFGKVVLHLREAYFPDNDMFADARLLSGERISVRANTVGASREAGEPDRSSGRKSLWWKWTAPHDGFLAVETGDHDWCKVYEGDALENLVEAPATERPEFYRVDGGRTYWLAAGDSGEENETRFDLVLGPASALFSRAENLGSRSGVARADSLEACSHELREPFHAGSAPEQSRWYRWTAPWNGEAVVSATPASGTMRVAVYHGTSIDRLRRVASGDGAVSFAANAGEEFRIAVDTGGGETEADYQFAIEFIAELPSGYAAWCDGFFAGDEPGAWPGDDPDGDGRDNLMEWSLGGDPKRFDASAAFTFDSWGGFVRLNVRRPAGVSGVWHRFEVSEDLVNWRPTTGLDRLQYIEDHGDGTETFHVILTKSRIADHPRLYFRLVAEPGEDPLGP